MRNLQAQLDPGAGWCGVFWSRDPAGMQACLDGAEVPPWDVMEALLRDLAVGCGAQAAEREAGLAWGLHSASLAAYDARPGGRGQLAERLDMMLTEQRFAVERQAELGRSLAAAVAPDEVERLSRDLAWSRDDHERATARCAELRERIERLDRAGRPQWVDFGTPLSDDFAGEEVDDFEARASGGFDALASGGLRGRSVGDFRAEEFDDSGERAATRFGASPSFRARGADGFGATAAGAAGGDPDAGASEREPRTREFGMSPADQSASVPDSRTLSVDSGPGPDSGSADSGSALGPESASDPDITPTPRETPRGPRPGRKSRDAFRRPRLPRGARFAGFTGPDADRDRDRGGDGGTDEDGHATGTGAVPVPDTAVRPRAASRPRGARFAHAAGPDGADEAVRREVVAPDREAEQATAETVAALVRLRGEGRSGEAHGVLVEAAGWPASRLPALAGELHRAGLGADWSTLLWEAASLPPEPLVSLADALASAGRADDCRKLLRQGVARPAPEIAEAVLALMDEGRERDARALLDAYLRVRAPEDVATCAHTDPYRLIPLLLQAAQGVSEERHWDLVHALRVAGFSA
ncbi:hypothetical protein ACFVXC_03175 [Streptomyces sp. NPDC058257]|uniref:hypothetical protein n=1 Tax=Streptomyces sp. NPDC058257 TaxID=3346409 RepID=UPI0036E31BEA